MGDRSFRPHWLRQPTPQAVRYHAGNNWLWGINQVSSLAIQAALLWSGFSAFLRDVARRIGRGWFLTIGIFCVLYSLVV